MLWPLEGNIKWVKYFLEWGPKTYGSQVVPYKHHFNIDTLDLILSETHLGPKFCSHPIRSLVALYPNVAFPKSNVKTLGIPYRIQQILS